MTGSDLVRCPARARVMPARVCWLHQVHERGMAARDESRWWLLRCCSCDVGARVAAAIGDGKGNARRRARKYARFVRALLLLHLIERHRADQVGAPATPAPVKPRPIGRRGNWWAALNGTVLDDG